MSACHFPTWLSRPQGINRYSRDFFELNVKELSDAADNKDIKNLL